MEEIEVDVESDQINNGTLEENNTDSVETNPASNKDKEKESPNQRQKFLRLPLARIKTMMKKDPDCGLLSQDAVFLVTKATVSYFTF